MRNPTIAFRLALVVVVALLTVGGMSAVALGDQNTTILARLLGEPDPDSLLGRIVGGPSVRPTAPTVTEPLTATTDANEIDAAGSNSRSATSDAPAATASDDTGPANTDDLSISDALAAASSTPTSTAATQTTRATSTTATISSTEPSDASTTSAARVVRSSSDVDAPSTSTTIGRSAPGRNTISTTTDSPATTASSTTEPRRTTETPRRVGSETTTTTVRQTTTRPPSTHPPSTYAPTTTRAATTTSPPTSSSTTTSTTSTTTSSTTTSTTSTTSSTTTAAPTSTTPRRGFDGVRLSDHTNTNAKIDHNGQDGSFRTVCLTSHFNFDDPIVFPGQKDATHLHMYFGNTNANHASTANSLMSSGDGTCQGGPLNRSAYWIPAVFDGNGDVRPAQYSLIYYKRAGNESVTPYPNGMKIVVGNAMAAATQPNRNGSGANGIDYEWYCGSPISGGESQNGRLIPDCAPGQYLTLSLVLPRCSDGRLDSPDHKGHMAYPAYYGAACPASHPIRHPQITYNIHWNNNDQRTGTWYLSSDKHGDLIRPGGTTTHADWIGAWHPEVLDIMTPGCFNASHDCKGGTISPSLRLVDPRRTPHSPSNIYDRNAAPQIIRAETFGALLHQHHCCCGTATCDCSTCDG